MPETKRPIGLLSIDTKAVYDRLTKAKMGETVSYDELSQLIGRDIRNGAYWCLQSARRKALIDGLVFGSVSKVGIKRLNDTEIVDTGHDAVTRIHRLSTRSARKVALAEYSTLSPESKVKFNTHVSILGVMAHMTRSKQVAKLTESVTKAQASLPLAKTLEAFKQ